ncbi:PAS domain S-box protein [Rhizobium sp. DKSPLA3]|uniref:Blue-light-activated histidine kinase n=1 Tax=Rhizobium quercicola TaxID=2901226 RepID=A0A9X1NSV3_9HYPH|nr:PAS domain S-box protein [Rhizobium quercicola]MCD7109381.1 PAS domain S-box protein [Rhizobium quercicola]
MISHDTPPSPLLAPKSDDLLRVVFESAVDFAIFSLDPEGRVTSWNTGAERVLGFTEADILGQSGEVIFTPEDRAAGVPALERAEATAHGRAEDERWQMRKDGTRFWASGLTMPLSDGSGFVRILRDRTEAHLAGQRLMENEERFRLLATTIPQLVFRCLADGSRLWGSPQWVDYSGLDQPQSLGLGWLNAVHPDDRAATLSAWQAAAGTGECYVEHRIRRASDGAYRWHQTRALPVLSAFGESTGDWIGTMTDIHALRAMKDRQDVLVAELQHRTRNLLAVVQSVASQTLRSSSSLESFGAEFSSRLRALSRVQGIAARAADTISLQDLIEGELRAHGTASRMEAVHAEGPPVTVPTPGVQALGLALHELATNAIKYGALSQETGVLRISWTLEDAAGERAVLLEWREEGVNMPGDDAPRRKGYGRELIERALPYQLNATTELQFLDHGIRCLIRVPLP